ncbi:MAG: BCD family MFS transporter [Pseudomonadota bacterium]
MQDISRRNSATHSEPTVAVHPKWAELGRYLLPFADAASDRLPLPRLLRLSLFQISVGMAAVLLTGAVNRVMIVELKVPAAIVAVMIALPLIFAPLRALIGHRSDTHRSVLGWRRAPFIWMGSTMQYGGFAVMPFALIVLATGPEHLRWVGIAAAAIAFLLVGAGMHTVQTTGLALATDIAPQESRPRVVALLYVMLLVGMGLSAGVFGFVLRDYSPMRLIQVIQGAAVITMVLNVIALWKQEARNTALTNPDKPRESFRIAWKRFVKLPGARRLLVVVGIGAAAFGMQDILLEPYGAEVLGLSVSGTTLLTGLFAFGMLGGFALAGRRLANGAEPHRLAGIGAVIGVAGFSTIVFADPFSSQLLFRIGIMIIGFGNGLFSVATLTALMALADDRNAGIALGAWGAVQATCTGVAVALGGAMRDVIGQLAMKGYFGATLMQASTGYAAVYHLEIWLLFVSLAIVGPLARFTMQTEQNNKQSSGVPAFPS